MKYILVVVSFACVCVSAHAQDMWGRTAAGAWDLFLSSRGDVGRDTALQGGRWPHGTPMENNYVHDGGFWFGCERARDTSLKLVEMNYCPHTLGLPAGATAFDPMRRGDSAESVYDSRDYNADGTPKSAGAPLWCIRNVRGDSLLTNGNSGDYVRDSAARAAKPPVFIGDQMLVAVYSDSAYVVERYPIGLAGTTTLYAWNNDSLKNCVLVKTTLQNTSTDTLVHCFVAPVYGFGVGDDSTNDQCLAYAMDSLSMYYASSETEDGKQLGVAGVSVINPPRGVAFHGAYTWADYGDPTNDGSRYDVLAGGTSGYALGTVRGMAASGPFTLAPDESIEFIYAVAAAIDTVTTDSPDSMSVRLVRTIQAARNFWFSFNAPSGIRNAAGTPQALALNAFPNPADQVACLSLPSYLSGTTTSALHVSLYDALGRVMPASIARSDRDQLTIASSSLPAGTYYVRCIAGTRVFMSTVTVTH